MRWKDFPEELGPLKENVADVERLQDPYPIVITEVQVLHDARRFCIANVPAVEIGQHIEKAHDGQHLLIELESSVSGYVDTR